MNIYGLLYLNSMSVELALIGKRKSNIDTAKLHAFDGDWDYNYLPKQLIEEERNFVYYLASMAKQNTDDLAFISDTPICPVYGQRQIELYFYCSPTRRYAKNVFIFEYVAGTTEEGEYYIDSIELCDIHTDVEDCRDGSMSSDELSMCGYLDYLEHGM